MKIYTAITFFSNGIELNTNEIKSFNTSEAALSYVDQLRSPYWEIIENELDDVRTD